MSLFLFTFQCIVVTVGDEGFETETRFDYVVFEEFDSDSITYSFGLENDNDNRNDVQIFYGKATFSFVFIGTVVCYGMFVTVIVSCSDP